MSEATVNARVRLRILWVAPILLPLGVVFAVLFGISFVFGTIAEPVSWVLDALIDWCDTPWTRWMCHGEDPDAAGDPPPLPKGNDA